MFMKLTFYVQIKQKYKKFTTRNCIFENRQRYKLHSDLQDSLKHPVLLLSLITHNVSISKHTPPTECVLNVLFRDDVYERLDVKLN